MARKRRSRGIAKGSAATPGPRRKTAKQPTASDATTGRRSLRYEEVMASNEDSATALFELANTILSNSEDLQTSLRERLSSLNASDGVSLGTAGALGSG